MLFLRLPGGYQGVCFLIIPSAIRVFVLCRFCASVLYFTMKTFLLMGLFGVHITYYSLSGIWPWGCLIINDALPFLLREKLEIHL